VQAQDGVCLVGFCDCDELLGSIKTGNILN